MAEKRSDTGLFIIGWIATALAVGLPLIFLLCIQKYYPEAYRQYGDKIAIIAYLIASFFSGLYTSYRVSCKADEKDLIINGLRNEIDESKKAYQSLSPKEKIISLLHEIHTKSGGLNKTAIQKLLIDKIGEINNDSSFNTRYDGALCVSDEQFKAKTKLPINLNSAYKSEKLDEYKQANIKFSSKRRL
ncbi:TPA: hypothetical protein O8L21_000574 [Enterobacter cloacae]|uniref:hypothetical protein n=1 Tax=Enterobacter cloacae complex TaxID=354276 RepID=UPI00202062D5|nr:hypothetical protein [Enterobacter cloacae complex sp. OE43NF]MCL7668294.1 hypothetical protein [Enterobacter cloacae complex sp. OE43NF]HCT3325014.1 hypothetical protein [Enterobacter cloacae]HDC4349315.1 hypothetical protein [Enterobacter cloacae]HDC4833407.1 hypothetical protein [Enterobacter cloacae]